MIRIPLDSKIQWPMSYQLMLFLVEKRPDLLTLLPRDVNEKNMRGLVLSLSEITFPENPEVPGSETKKQITYNDVHHFMNTLHQASLDLAFNVVARFAYEAVDPKFASAIAHAYVSFLVTEGSLSKEEVLTPILSEFAAGDYLSIGSYGDYLKELMMAAQD